MGRLFTANISKFLKQEEIVSLLLKNTEVERDVSDAKKVYDKHIKNLKCVWSDKKLTSKNYEVDHLLPYSITYINDLWNLLPTYSDINRKKSNKIPVPSLIEARKNPIKFYWNLLFKEYKEKFLKDMKIGLVGAVGANTPELFNFSIEKLKQKSKFLINKVMNHGNLKSRMSVL